MNSLNKPGIEEDAQAIDSDPGAEKKVDQQPQDPPEIGGPKGLEPTRYGDWEKGGRCIDF